MKEKDILSAFNDFKKENPDASNLEIIVNLRNSGFSDDELKDFTFGFEDDTTKADSMVLDDISTCEAVPDMGDLFDLPDDIKNELNSSG